MVLARRTAQELEGNGACACDLSDPGKWGDLRRGAQFSASMVVSLSIAHHESGHRREAWRLEMNDLSFVRERIAAGDQARFFHDHYGQQWIELRRGRIFK